MLKKLSKLQKSDKDTNELIDKVREYLFSIGIRTSRERAWDIFQAIHKMPYEILITKNKVIKYQGQGQHISHKNQPSQVLTIKDIGKFEIKAVSSTKSKPKRASIKFVASKDIQKMLDEKVEVID